MNRKEWLLAKEILQYFNWTNSSIRIVNPPLLTKRVIGKLLYGTKRMAEIALSKSDAILRFLSPKAADHVLEKFIAGEFVLDGVILSAQKVPPEEESRRISGNHLKRIKNKRQKHKFSPFRITKKRKIPSFL